MQIRGTSLSALCFFLFVVVATRTSFGQVSNDCIITLANDTIVGDIKEARNYASSISFKKTSNSEFRNYTIEDVISFSKNDIFYHAVYNPSTKQQEFRELLLEGSIQLYNVNQTKKSISFIAIKEGQSFFLEEKTITDEVVERKEYLYVRELKQLIIDQSDLVKKVDKLEFNKRNIITLIDTYNQRLSIPSVNLYDSYKKYRSVLHAELSIANKGLNPQTRFFPNNVSKEFKQPNFGIGLHWSLLDRKNNSLSVGLKFYKLNSSIHENFTITKREIKLNNLIIAIPLRFTVEVSKSSMRPFVFGEVEYQRILGNVNTDNTHYSRKTSFGLGAGIGLRLNKKIKLGLRYSNSLFELDSSIETRDVLWHHWSLDIGFPINIANNSSLTE